MTGGYTGSVHCTLRSSDGGHCKKAVGFPLQPVEELPLSWPVELRRPSGRRRLGAAFVMDAGVQAQLSSLGPLTEMIPGPVLE